MALTGFFSILIILQCFNNILCLNETENDLNNSTSDLNIQKTILKPLIFNGNFKTYSNKNDQFIPVKIIYESEIETIPTATTAPNETEATFEINSEIKNNLVENDIFSLLASKHITPTKFLARLRKNLDFGHAIIVKGTTGGKYSYGPSINLMNGNCNWNERHNCDLILNMYVNLTDPINQVQRTFYTAAARSYSRIETYGGAPFEPYKNFEVQIIPRTDLFEIKVNKQYFASFSYKMPLYLVNHILISTTGNIDSVKIYYLQQSDDGVERVVGGEDLENFLK